MKLATQKVPTAAGVRTDEFFVSCPTQSHYAASQLWSAGVHSLPKTRLTAVALGWEEVA